MSDLNDVAALRPAAAESESAGTRMMSLRALLWVSAGSFAVGAFADRVSIAAQVQLVGLCAAAFWFGFIKGRLEIGALAIAHIAGCEVLWRMTRVAPVWELGKYLALGLAALLMLRARHAGKLALPLAYALLLTPAAVLTTINFPQLAAHDLSFNLAGHAAGVLVLWFFSSVEVRRSDVERLFCAMWSGALMVGAITLLTTAGQETIEWRNDSNFATSGGFGPNQVSSALGLGAFAAVAQVYLRRKVDGGSVLCLGVGMFLGVQAVLTFSRSGAVGAIAAILVGLVLLMGQKRARSSLLAASVGIVVVCYVVVLPWLESFTQGMVLVRYKDGSLSGRDELLYADLDLWQQHPVFGAGVGQAADYHLDVVARAAVHTEYSRLLAEHGLLGGILIVLLIVAAARSVLRSPDPSYRAVVAGSALWAFLYMSNAAMRLAAPSIVLGLAIGLTAPLGRRK